MKNNLFLICAAALSPAVFAASGDITLQGQLAAGGIRKKILFEYDPAQDARISKELRVEQAAVAGTFNDWNKNSDIMHKDKNGVFRKTLSLEQGVYYYKFVLNNTVWVEDSTADTRLRADDGTGGGKFNSGVSVRITGRDYGGIVKGGINMSAVKHDSSSGFYSVQSPCKVRVVMRTAAGDAHRVELTFTAGSETKTEQMRLFETKKYFDYYEAVLEFKPNIQYFSYYFKLYDLKAEEIYMGPGKKRFTGFTGLVKNIPAWAKDAVWYQIFPERFRNGDESNDPKLKDINAGDIKGWKIKKWTSDWYAPDEWEKKNFKSVFQSIFCRRYGGDLKGIIDKLDYLKELGVTALYLNPVFRSPSLHKYDGSCFHHIDETFGPDPEGDRKMIKEANETDAPSTWVWTSADRLFLKLVKEAHSRDMKIIIDGVFNHSGRGFFAFQDILKNRKKSKYAGWYDIKRWDDSLADGFEYGSWFGIKDLPQFRRDENNVDENYKRYVFNSTDRWMKPLGKTADGVDGWRLDVAFCLPHGFWKEWRRAVKKINPDAYIVAEVVEVAPEYLQGDEFDALMNYPFACASTEFFVDKKNRVSASEFDSNLAHIRNAYPAEITKVMQNLYCSHDTARLATLVANPDYNYRDWGAFFNRSKVEMNPSFRIDRGNRKDLDVRKLMVIFQMTYIGAPMIYYGDEAGMTGANDPDCRKPMLWDDFRYDDETVHPSPGFSRPAEKNAVNRELLEHCRKMIRIRNENAALRRGDFTTVVTDDKKDLFGFARRYGKEEAVVILNNSLEKQEAVINLADRNNANYTDVLNGGGTYTVKNNRLTAGIKPKWALILVKQE
ncbi:MAG: alpha amylase N-terminal ig-like domain-containing protein [Elusimicrobiota bacterium]|nr:alpha amylase N-terminal ig-like domain-containing protein [Elusimicrobiota bacterium]